MGIKHNLEIKILTESSSEPSDESERSKSTSSPLFGVIED